MWPTIMMLVFLQATIGFRVSSIAVPCNRTDSSSVEPLVLIQNFTTYTLDNCDTMITFSSNQSISNVMVIANGGNVTPSVFVTGRVLEEVRIGLYDIVSQPPPTEPPVWLKLLSFIGTSTASSLAVAHNIVVRVSNTTLSNYQGDLVYIGAPIVDGFILILEDSDFTYAQMAETSVYLYGRQIGTNAEFIGASVSNVKMTQIGGRWNVTVHSYNRTMGFWSIFGYLTTTNVEFVVQETTTILAFSHEVSINITIDKYCLQVIDVTDPGNLINFATTLTDFTFVNTMEMDPRVEDCTTDFRILFLSASGADEPPNVNVSNVAISVSNAKFTMFGANQGLMFQYRGYSHISSASFVAENVSSTVIAQGLSADSARSTVLLTYVIVAQLTNWSFIARNILFHGELNHANKLEYYSSSTGCLLLLQNAQTEIGVVDILNVSVDAVVNERTVGNVLGVGVLMNQFAVTLSLVVFLSSVSTTVSIDIKDSVINTHGTVVGPYFSGLVTVFVNYVALCVGVVVMQNNCTSCNISLLRTNINASKTYILPPDSPSAWPITDHIICNVLSSLNITAFVIGVDPSIVIQTCLIPNMEFLKSFPTIMSSIYGISMDPMLHTMMNVTVKDSWIRTPDLDPTDVNQRSLGVSVLGAPRLVDNVHLNATNVTSYGAYTVASTMIFAMTRANEITVYLEDVSGLQHCIETRIFYANISNFKLIMNRGHFIRHPFARVSLFDTFSLTLQPTSAPLSAAVTPFISIVNTTFDAGVAGIFGATLNLDNMPRKSIYLGCNLWGAANRTTVDVYRQQAVFAVNRTKRFDAHQSQLDLSGACVPPPTPAPPTPSPTTSPAASRGASAVAIVGLSVASSIPSVGATPSFVRLQTTMIALKIRDMCDSDDESNTVVYGESPFENPTQVSVPSLGDDYAMAGGTVLMNIVLVVAVAVLAASLRIAPKMWKQRDNMAILSWKSKLKIWLRHFPGSGVVLFSVFLQPTITSAVSVMTSGSGNGIIIGLIGLTFFMGVLIYVSYIVIKTFPMYFRLNPPRQPKIPAEKMRTRVRHDSDDDDDDECCGEEWTSFWITFSESPGEWVVSSSPSQHQRSSQINRSATSFHHRYSALYEPFRGGWHWYFVVDLAVAALSGLVSGLAGAPLPCDVVLWLLVGLCGISTAGSLFIRPSGPPMENLINIVVNGLGLASCVTIALSLDSISNDVALAQLVASMIMSVVDAFRWFFGLFWQRNIRHRARRKLKEQLRAMFGDIQDASRKVGQHGSAILHRAFQRSAHINTPKGRLQALILQICESQKKNRQSFSSSRSTGGSSTPRSQLQAAHAEERRQLFQHIHPTHSPNHYNHHQRHSSSPPPQPTAVHRQFLWTQKQFADHVDPNDL